MAYGESNGHVSGHVTHVTLKSQGHDRVLLGPNISKIAEYAI